MDTTPNLVRIARRFTDWLIERARAPTSVSAPEYLSWSLFAWLFLRERVAATHPSLGTDARQPIRYGRNDATAIFLDMPLCNVPHRYNVTIAVGDRLSEYPLALVNTQRVMSQRAVPEIAILPFAVVEPLMYPSVIVYLSAETTDR